MAHFPTAFPASVSLLQQDIGSLGNASLAQLQEKGYVVSVGLTKELAEQVIAAAKQHHISDYFCQKDPTDARFASMESTENWLKHDGGRGMFLLLSKSENGEYLLNGYGWAGLKPMPELPDHPVTLAIRITEAGLGKRLSKDFLQVIISATHTLFAPEEGMSLESFDSNEAAKRGYTHLGFQLVTVGEWQEVPGKDPQTPGGLMDRRTYMSYPNHLLNQ